MHLSPDDIERFRRAGLTPRQIRCLAWYFFEHVSQPVIAEWLGIRQPNVYRLLRRGRARLAKVGIELPEICSSGPRHKMTRHAAMDPAIMDCLQPHEIAGVA